MNRVEQFRALLGHWENAGLDRRTFLRLVAVGTSASTLAAMIASPATAMQSEATAVAEGQIAHPTAAPFVDRPFSVGLSVEPDNLDVQDTTSNSSASVDKCIYEGLVTLDHEMRVVNLLAESWEVSDDALEFTFVLHQGVTFHDGEPFNAEAVVRAFDRVLAEGSTLRRANYFSAVIDHVEAVDEYTVKFVASEPFAAMVATLAHPAGGIPSPTAAEAAGEDFGSNPVGTGPFRFVEWVRGDHITLEANPDYWNPELAAAVPSMTLRGMAEPSALGIAVQSGDATFAGPLEASQAQLLREDENVEVTETDGMTIYWVTLNNSKEPFNDVNVRQALNYGVNKEQVLMAGSLGEGYIADSPIARSVWGYAETGGYEYDPDRARELLAEAGYPDGFSTELWTSATHRDRAVAVQGQLAQIGVQAEVVQMESAALTEEQAKPVEESNIQMMMTQWSPSTGDADWALRPIYTEANWPPAGSTFSFFTDPEVETAIQQGLELPDPEERAAAYATALTRIMELAPNLFLYVPTYFGAISREAGGCTTQADGVVFLRTAHWKE
jgi:glutathione transport system substrate-binding protein